MVLKFCEFSEDNLNLKGPTQIQGSTSPLSILSQVTKKTGEKNLFTSLWAGAKFERVKILTHVSAGLWKQSFILVFFCQASKF